jgi:hypothetical protein
MSQYFISEPVLDGHETHRTTAPFPMPSDAEAFLTVRLPSEAIEKLSVETIKVTVRSISELASAGVLLIRVAYNGKALVWHHP